VIQDLKHYVFTVFGDSINPYSGDKSQPALQGLLQGNAMAPPSWTSIATVIVDAMCNEGFRYDTWCTISARAITIVTFQLVDDTNLVLSNDELEAKLKNWW
jgi:hypothetical protein